MKYAIIEDGVVVNIAESNHALEWNWVLIPIGNPVGIGDIYDGRLFYAPDGSVRMTPEASLLHAQLAACETAFAEGVIEGWA